jgi:hypothetical protein
MFMEILLNIVHTNNLLINRKLNHMILCILNIQKKGEESLVSTSISIPDNCFLKQNKQGNISY